MQVKIWRRAAILASAVAASCHTMDGLAAPISFNGGTYTQNFSALPIQVATFNATTAGSFATGSAASASPTGTFSFATLSTPFDFDASNTSGGLGITQLAGFYGGASTSSQFGAHNGGTTTGGVIDFGMNAGQANAGQRFLGLLDTSSVAPESYFGLGLVNNTGSSISSFNLGFVAALWRQSNLGKVLNFGYEIAPAGSSEPTATTSLTSIGAVSFGTLSSAVGGVANDGTAAANQKTVSDTVSVPGGIPAGSDLYLQWYFNDSTGKAQGIGISTLSFSLGSGTGGGGTTAQIDTYSVGAGSGAFDTTTVNFTANGSPTKYTDGDAVVFPDTLNGGVGTVNVTVPSVSPSSITVSNNTGTYSIIGNPINGTGSLTKTGNGTLTLSPTTSNGYSGGTNINGGQVVIASDAALGAPTGAIGFNTGSLIVTSPITSARSLNFTGAGTLDTGVNATTFASAGGTGAFTKVGTGNLTFTGNYSSGTLALQNGNLVFAGSITGANGGTVSLNPGSSGNALGGNVVLAGNIDLSVVGVSTATNAGALGGSGSILVQASGSAITNAKASSSTINNNIALNSTGAAFTPGDVTQSPFVAGSFATVIGGTTAATGKLNINGTISGNSDVVLSNDPIQGGGSGVLAINQPATYHGTTVVNFTSGSVVSGVNNALPATTDVIIGGSDSYYAGAPAGTPGVDGIAGDSNTGTVLTAFMNLAGHNQQFSSISDGDNYVVGGLQSGSFSIINTSSTPSTLTISGATNPANGFSAGVIGGGTVNNNINLVKGGSNYLVLNNTSTYTGSTTIRGGTLSIGSGQSSQLGLSESIASTNISLQGIDSHATLALYSSTALANGATTAVNVITGGSGIEIDLNYSGVQVFNELSINGATVPNGLYNASNEPTADQTLFVGIGSVSVVPEPSLIGLTGVIAPLLLRRRRRNVDGRRVG